MQGAGNDWCSPLKNTAGFVGSDRKSKGSILNQQFSSVFTREPTQDWRDADVVPIYKKGDTHIPANLQARITYMHHL